MRAVGWTLELTARIQAARAAYHREVRQLVLSRRATEHMRGTFARVYEAVCVAVLLYGSDVWALSPQQQLERLEVTQRGMLRQSLPGRLRRRHWEERMSNTELLRFFRLPTVATLLARQQLRWLGHLARLEESRVSHMLMSGRRVLPGVGAR